MRRIILALCIVGSLFIIFLFEEESQPIKRKYDPETNLVVPIEILGSHKITLEDLKQADPMTGVIAGELLGGKEIEEMTIRERNRRFYVPVQYSGNHFHAENLPVGKYQIGISGVHRKFMVNLGPGEVCNELQLEDWKYDTDLKIKIIPGTAPPYRSRRLGIILTITMDNGGKCTETLFTDLPEDGIIDTRMPSGQWLTVHIMSSEMGGVLVKTIPINSNDNPFYTTIKLDPWPEITGRVLDKTQTPIEKASVRIDEFGDESQQWLQDHHIWNQFHRKIETNTGPDGKFRLTFPRYWRASLHVKADAFISKTINHLEAGYESFDVQLNAGKESSPTNNTSPPRPMRTGKEYTYKGQLKTVDGSMLPPNAFFWSSDTWLNITGHSTENGQFALHSQNEIHILQSFGVPFDVISPGYIIDYKPPQIPSPPNKFPEEVKISEDKPLELGIRQAALGMGRIVSVTGEPIVGAIIRCSGTTSTGSYSSQASISGNDGRFSITLPVFDLSQANPLIPRPPVLYVEHKDYSATYFGPFETKAGQAYEFKEFVLPEKHVVRVNLKYKNPKQKDLWTFRHGTCYTVRINNKNHTMSNDKTENSFDTFARFPATPYTSFDFSPKDNQLRYLLFRLCHRESGNTPDLCYFGKTIPESITMTAQDLPIKRARLLDENGEIVRETEVYVTFIQERRPSLFARLLSLGKKQSSYHGEKFYTITNHHGYFNFIDSPRTKITVEVQTQKGVRPPSVNLFGITEATLPVGLFRPKAGPDIGNLVLSATSSRGLRIATPE